MAPDGASGIDEPSKLYNETTFRGYSHEQAQEYARARGGYPRTLIDEIISLHLQTGGGSECVLDLGCGPGSATRDLATHFDKAIGIDPSPEMINSAKQHGETARHSSIQFLSGDAEECEGIPDNSVDLITAATAAHWFDMERFWQTAARVLRPGGTVAFFTIWRIYCQPSTTPHAERIQAILMELEQRTLAPYLKPGNWALMGLYKDLQMPWSFPRPLMSFPESLYRYQVWNERGLPTADGTYVCGERRMSLEDAEKAIATTSAVTRWREANPALAHTSSDCVKATFAKIGDILGPERSHEIIMVGPTVLVTVKKQ